MSRQESNNIVDEARLLLPWYLTNTLSDEEQALVNKALEESAELRGEFLQEEQMMRLVKENTSLLELSALDTTEQRLEKTLARIEREESQLNSNQTASAPQKKSPAKQLDSWFNRLFKQKLFDIDWLTPANAVFASLLIMQVGLFAFAQNPKAGDTAYHVASVVEQSPVPNSGNIKNLFLMEFQSDAQHREVCDFLNEWNARIVSGPNNANIFEVEIETNPHADVVAFAQDVMKRAEDKSAPVVFIGPLYQDKSANN